MAMNTAGWFLFLYFSAKKVYFIQPNTTHYEFASEGFTICTRTTSLTFDLTSDQGKLPKNTRKKTFRSATEEDPSPGRTEEEMS